MGRDVECTLRLAGRAWTGRAWLETDHILFRGPERVKIALGVVQNVAVAGGTLRLEYPGGPAELELGDAAAMWEQKILHPPSLLEKLGVKAGLKISLSGAFDEAFRAQLPEHAGHPAKGSELILLAANTAQALERVPKLVDCLVRRGALWIVYPKGSQAVRQNDVFLAARSVGLKDVKVASFSETHTALKFVRPLRPL